MKTKLTLMVLVGLFVVLSGYVYLNKSGSETISSNSMTFTEFLSKEGSYKCEIKRLLDKGLPSNMTVKGTAYVANGTLRVDFDKTLSLIYKDKKTYNWRPEGNVIGADDFDGWIVEDRTYGPSTYQWDATMVTDFSCEKWKTDLTKFTPPEQVVFRK